MWNLDVYMSYSCIWHAALTIISSFFVTSEKVIHLYETESQCQPSEQNWDYYPGALSLSQVATTQMKIGHL